MSTSTHWQLDRSAAESYRDVLERSFLGPFAGALVRWCAPGPSDTVLDVGCGTGAAILAARTHVGPHARLIGVDVNAAMLEVARERDPGIEWLQAPATQLPFASASVDHLFCAQTLQFVSDRATAVREIARVLRPGGRVAISLWLPQPSNPYNSTVIDVIGQHLGREVAAALAAAFSLGDPSAIVRYLRDEGVRDVVVEPHEMALPLPPLRQFVPNHIAGTPMAGPFSAAAPHVQERIVREIIESLEPYGDPANVPFRAHFIRGTR